MVYSRHDWFKDIATTTNFTENLFEKKEFVIPILDHWTCVVFVQKQLLTRHRLKPAYARIGLFFPLPQCSCNQSFNCNYKIFSSYRVFNTLYTLVSVKIPITVELKSIIYYCQQNIINKVNIKNYLMLFIYILRK